MKYSCLLSRYKTFLFLIPVLWIMNSLIIAQDRGQGVVTSLKSDNRSALVIGNGRYQSSPLINSVNDARDFSEILRKLDFKVVELIDADKRGMTDAIRDFGEALKQGSVGLFYFAGHGIQVNGRNYLIPVNADIRKEDDIEFEAVDVTRLLRTIASARNRPNIVILDACRNNPFARSFRSQSQGLAYMDAPAGLIIAYATAPGMVASDGSERNGLYTAELLKQVSVPGIEIKDIFMRVTAAVESKTNGAQVPWQSVSLTEPFYFIGQGSGETAQKVRPKPSSPDAQIKQVQTPGKSVESNFFRFELLECRASGGELKCEFLVTNTDNIDKELRIQPDYENNGTLAWDNMGNSYSAREIYLANNSIQALVPFGTQMKLKIGFVGASQGAKLLSKIEIVGVAGNRILNVSFRDICLIDSCRNVSLNVAPGAIQQTKSIAGFQFDLLGCRVSGSEIVCELLITNVGSDDKQLLIHTDHDTDGTKAWDNMGNSYSAREINLANNRASGNVTLGAQPKLRILFRGSAQGAQRLSKIEIVGVAGNNNFRFDFRNISL